MRPILAPVVLSLPKPTVRETAVLLAVAWLVPFAVHLLPWSGERPLGAYLLPMFWTTFVASYLFGLRTGLLVGLFAPLLNLLVTGLPVAAFVGLMSFELVLFAALTSWAARRLPRLPLIAPFAYVLARLALMLLLAVLPGVGSIGSPLTFMIGSVTGAWPGLLVLTALNLALVRFYPLARAARHDSAAV